MWQRNQSGIAPFFSFPEDIRKAIYTTNAIEATNHQIHKIINNRGVFPDDKSTQKIIFLALTNASKKWAMPIKNGAMDLNQFAILCDTSLPNWANVKAYLHKLPDTPGYSFFCLDFSVHYPISLIPNNSRLF